MFKRLWSHIKESMEVERAVASWELTRQHLTEREREQSDLSIALQFLPEHEHMTLAVNKAEYIPYVKRMLFRELGEPSRVMSNQVWYGRKSISLVSLASEQYSGRLHGVREEQVFLIETF